MYHIIRVLGMTCVHVFEFQYLQNVQTFRVVYIAIYISNYDIP